MKFSCKTQEFSQALSLVSRIISNQQALPILSNVLIQVEGKRCTISATDLELSIITSIDANIENEGTITIPAKAILNFAQYNSDEEILLETSEGTQLKCTSKHAKTMISGESASEYPTITTVQKENSFSLDIPPLLDVLHLVTFASAKTTLRPILSGVYLRSEKDNLIFVSTDSYRLSEYTISTKKGGDDVSCIIPAKVLEELKVILSSLKKDLSEKDLPKVDIALSSQQIELKVGSTQLISRLIEGKFPDYQKIIPTDFKTEVLFPTREMVTTCKRMHYFAKEINNNLTFTFNKDGVHVITPQTQAGRDEATFTITPKGDDNKIALSSAYLLDFLNHIDEDSVEVYVVDSMHPTVFRIKGNKDFLHLVMPLRIQED